MNFRCRTYDDRNASITAKRLAGHRFSQQPTPLSILIHLLSVLAAGALLNFVHALMQPIFLVSVVPISVAGWGVRESAMAFAYAGLMGSDGLIVAEAARYGFLSRWSLGRGNLE